MPWIWLACRASVFRPFDDAAPRCIAAAGIGWVEMHAPRFGDVPALRAELQRLGLRVSVLQGACDLTRADAAEQVRCQMPVFAALDCRRMLIRGTTDPVGIETACARLRAAADVAAAHGVTILVETHPGLALNADTALATLTAVRHPAVRINFDPANIVFYNKGLDPLAELGRIAPRIGGVHLKDTPGGFRVWNFPALGRGVIDFPRLFAMLDAAGFDGPCTLELDGQEGELRTLELLTQRVQESLEYLRRIGCTW